MSLVEEQARGSSYPPGSPRPLAIFPRRALRFFQDTVEVATVLADVVIIINTCIFSAIICNTEGSPIDLSRPTGAGMLFSALFILWMKNLGMYKPSALRMSIPQIRAACMVWVSVLLMLIAALLPLGLKSEFFNQSYLAFAIMGLCAICTHRLAWRWWLEELHQHASRRVILIADYKKDPQGLVEAFSRLGLRPEHSVQFPLDDEGADYHEHTMARVVACARELDIEEIIIIADPQRLTDVRLLADKLGVLPCPVTLVPTGLCAEIFKRPSRVLGDFVCLEIQRRPMSFAGGLVKRSLDVVGATIALIVLSPLFLAVAIAIKMDSPGPIFFNQQRCGFNGCRFRILKFRTMSVLEDGARIEQAQRLDKRLTPVGKWLRRLSIDELPQLVNVLQGTMSLVGPRPHALAHDLEFDAAVQNYSRRKRVKPGLTGWAQVHGCRGPTPTRQSVERRVAYDLWYIENWSVRLDLLILMRTAFEVARGRNAY
jgi:putative colanic acid biosynthesis UDP-glucose lipid carrier transferase